MATANKYNEARKEVSRLGATLPNYLAKGVYAYLERRGMVWDGQAWRAPVDQAIPGRKLSDGELAALLLSSGAGKVAAAITDFAKTAIKPRPFGSSSKRRTARAGYRMAKATRKAQRRQDRVSRKAKQRRNRKAASR